MTAGSYLACGNSLGARSGVNQILISDFFSDDHPQRLQRPLRGRMRGHIDVGQPPRAVLDHDKHIQHSKCRSDRDEEVTSHNRPCMVLQKGGAALIAARLAWRSLRHVFADRSWRDPDPELDR